MTAKEKHGRQKKTAKEKSQAGAWRSRGAWSLAAEKAKAGFTVCLSALREQAGMRHAQAGAVQRDVLWECERLPACAAFFLARQAGPPLSFRKLAPVRLEAGLLDIY